MYCALRRNSVNRSSRRHIFLWLEHFQKEKQHAVFCSYETSWECSTFMTTKACAGILTCFQNSLSLGWLHCCWKEVVMMFIVNTVLLLSTLRKRSYWPCKETFSDLQIFEHFYRHMAGLLGKMASPSWSLFLHRTLQHGHIHASSGIRTHGISFWAAGHHALDHFKYSNPVVQ